MQLKYQLQKLIEKCCISTSLLCEPVPTDVCQVSALFLVMRNHMQARTSTGHQICTKLR